MQTSQRPSRTLWLCAVLLAAASCRDEASAQSDASLPACRAGLHVPLVNPRNYSGTIVSVDVAKGSYEIKADDDGLIDWVPARLLRYSCNGEAAAAITQSYYYGRWRLFIGPTAHYEDIDSEGYLVVGSGAHVPPLQINVDGSYVWRLDSQTSIRGHWRPLADGELRSGTTSPAILLLAGESGANWEVSRAGVNQGDNADAISIDRMDLGLSYQGTRLR